MSELLDAVDELTKPQTVTVIQSYKDHPDKKTQIVHPPRLDQLRAAISEAMSSDGSSSALASQRNLLNTSALYDWLMITNRINDWAQIEKSRVTRNDPGRTLRAWYAKWIGKEREPASVNYHLRYLQKWVAQIDTTLDPPRIKDLPDACPICDATAWWNPKTREQYPRPLIVTYRETGPNMIQDARGMCRACEEVFTVRQLAYAIEQKSVG